MTTERKYESKVISDYFNQFPYEYEYDDLQHEKLVERFTTRYNHCVESEFLLSTVFMIFAALIMGIPTIETVLVWFFFLAIAILASLAKTRLAKSHMKKIKNYDYYIMRTICDEYMLQPWETFDTGSSHRNRTAYLKGFSGRKKKERLTKMWDFHYSRSKLFDVIHVKYRNGVYLFVIPVKDSEIKN